MDNNLRLGVVHIIEWLRGSDVIRTGWDLFNELEPLGIMSKPQVPVDFHRVETRAPFLDLLKQFEEEYRQTRRSPVLQIETHGGKDGIEGDEVIEWPELMEAFIPLNRLTGVNTVVVLAACEGFYGVKMLQPDRRAAAFRGLLAPCVEVSTGNMQKAMIVFYRTLFARLDGDTAVKAMNDAVSPDQETFWLISAEDAFKTVNRSHFAEHCTPEALRRRRERLMSRVARKHRTGLASTPEFRSPGSGSTRPRRICSISGACSNVYAESISSSARSPRTMRGSTSRSTSAGPLGWSFASTSGLPSVLTAHGTQERPQQPSGPA